MNEEVYNFPSIFPTPETEAENRVIGVSGYGLKEFAVLMSKFIPDLNFYATPQRSFPFYTYDEDGTNRRENITDWALTQFREHYRDEAITKRDIFHYIYALLNHPDYRERYQANLKRDLPHLPYTPDFWGFAKAGERLGEIHTNYEEAEEYPLRFIETPDTQTQLERRKNETIQRQYTNQIQRLPNPRRDTRKRPKIQNSAIVQP